MNALQSLLKMVAARQADELRLGVERAPLVLSAGVPQNLTLAETGERVLRQMLGSLLSPQAEASLARGEPYSSVHDAGEGFGVYQVEFIPRRKHEVGFDVRLTNARHHSPTPTANADIASAPDSPAVPTSAAASVSAPLAAAPAAPTASAMAAGSRSAAITLTSSLEDLLARAAALRASDIHVRQGEPAYARVDGQLSLLRAGAHDIHELLGSAAEDAAARSSADWALSSPSAGRVRLHTFLAGGLRALAVRLLPSEIPSLSALGLPNELRDLAALPNGLVLLTGPAGSGKSTTAAALCQELIRQRSVMLLTLEDPVEYAFDARQTNSIVRQRQIGVDVPDFVSGLRDALREDPDVLLVGEMRDAESIGLALTAAETGHLVFATLHSRGAASAIDRIIDAYPAAHQQQLRVQLSESLRAVIAQRLLPRARGNGRVLAFEVLRRNAAVANLIREGKTPQLTSAMQSSRKEGMLLLERSLAELCRSGAVEERQAFAVANDQDSLMEYLHARRT
ncbi:MAG TPA: PilT/PilU family type 4a pilus ATPase [Polyangiaceae bacterium]|nr:PilT/PilU family type 4a pilus ATPase [Polyangiaceae bacterium]